MPVTFENDNDMIVYALECVIAHARRTQQVFVAQCVWWLASVIGLEQELVSHIDKLQSGKDTTPQEQLPREDLATPKDLAEVSQVDQVLNRTEQYLRESKQLREIVALKTSGTTTTGRINPMKRSKKSLRRTQRISKDAATNNDCIKTEGIEVSEIRRRKAADECLRCAWPGDRKGNHRVKDCRRQIKLDKRTANPPKDRNYQKPAKSSEGSDSTDISDS